jgi:hypothetical protein
MLRKIKAFIREKPEYLIYLYFLLVAGSLAYLLVYAIVPDEGVHYAAVEYYAKHTPSPFVGPQTGGFEAGELAKNGSFFYYYLLGFFYNIADFLQTDPLVPLRMLSVVASVGTLILLGAIADFWKIEKKAKLAGLFLVANIPMFLFISAGVNYDAWIIFLATLAAYILLRLAKQMSLVGGLALLNIIVFGPLIKLAFAPLSIVATSFLILLTIRSYVSKKVSIKMPQKRQQFVSTTLLVCLFLLGAGLFVGRYVNNYAKYQKLNPDCDQVMSVQVCSRNFVYRRAQIYKNANLTEPEVRSQIYLPSWVGLMVERTYGLLGHKLFINSLLLTNIGVVLFYVMLASFIRKFRFEWGGMYIVLAAATYLTGLILTNISSYKETQEIGLAVQGRYWFPVLIPFIFYIMHLNNKFLTKYSNKLAYRLVIVVVVLFSIYSGIPNILRGTNRSWFREHIPVIQRLT